MKITGIRVYRVDLPLVEGRYTWSDGRHVEVFDSTVVEILTDSEFVGYGEVCPLGPFYLPAFGAGARAGIGELAPYLLGEDPTATGPINRLMDSALLGHPYVKSAIDMACWDLLGKSAGRPVCELLGGRFGDSVELYRAISQRPADEMAENVAQYRDEGYRKFQLKVGGDPALDIARIRAASAVLQSGETLVADANTGWRVDDAARVVNAVRDIDVYIEQPCLSYDHCLATRRRTSLPFILDENIDGADALLRAHHEASVELDGPALALEYPLAPITHRRVGAAAEHRLAVRRVAACRCPRSKDHARDLGLGAALRWSSNATTRAAMRRAWGPSGCSTVCTPLIGSPCWPNADRRS